MWRGGEEGRRGRERVEGREEGVVQDGVSVLVESPGRGRGRRVRRWGRGRVTDKERKEREKRRGVCRGRGGEETGIST